MAANCDGSASLTRRGSRFGLTLLLIAACMPSPASSAAATQAEERGDQPKVEADAQAAAPDPSQLARRWERAQGRWPLP